ncbi:MAG: hypothetical protein ACRDYW_08140, partial [Acidimicrobiales bacterium]
MTRVTTAGCADAATGSAQGGADMSGLKRSIAAIVAVGGLLLAACGDDDDSTEPAAADESGGGSAGGDVVTSPPSEMTVTEPLPSAPEPKT